MLAVPVRDISRVMGLKKPPTDLAQLMAAIEHGLPKHALTSVLDYFSGHLSVRRNDLCRRVLSPATFERRKLLKPHESEKVARLARLIAYARFAWNGDDEAIRAFFLTPHPLLGDRRPLDLAFSELGGMRIERMLANVLHGLPT